MKRVLIPIDFSEISMHALATGIDIANHINANVRVIHVKTGMDYAPSFAKNQAEYQLTHRIDGWMDDLMKEHRDKYLVPGGQFDYKLREGNVYHEISNQAKYDDSTMIVVGSHGESGFQSKFIGSNAYRLVAMAPCPVLVVNKRMQWKGDFSKMVVPIDYSKASRQKVPILAGFAKVFNSKVYLVGLRATRFQFLLKRVTLFSKQVERYLVHKAGLHVESSIIIGKDLVERVIAYAESVDADMITVHIHHSTNPFASWFKPFANKLINESTKPVFVIPTKD